MWWQEPQRIVQTNLRLIDAGLDPQTLAGDLKAFGATAMLFNVGGIFSWYPSKLPLQAPNPKLQQGRDLVSEMVTAAHEEGIKVIGRYDLSKGTSPAFEKHPDWFCRGIDGMPFEYHGTYQACVNGGWYRAQAMEVIKETLSRYPLDGLFFNMFGYLRTDYSYAAYDVCHCDNCQRTFKEFSGMNLPASYHPSEPALREYLRFQDVTSQELRSAFRNLIKEVRPDIGISNAGKQSDFFRGEVNRRLDRDQEWIYQSGEQARTYRSMGANKIRYSSALTHFVDFPWRYASESAPLQVLRLAQQLANGADPHYYFMGTPFQVDREPMSAVSAVFDLHRRYQAQYADLESVANVGLYASAKSARFGQGTSNKAFRGAYQALMDAGIGFDIVHDSRTLDEDFVESHQRYDVIVIPGCDCMSQQEVRALDAYVEAGGSLVVTGDVATHDEHGAELTEFRLNSLPVHREFSRHESMRGGYMVVDREHPLPIDTDVVLMDGPYFQSTPKSGARALHTIQLPQRFGPPELCFADPECSSSLPALISGQYGKGQVTYIPWQIDVLYASHCLSTHREIIAGNVASRCKAPVATLTGASRVEMTVQRQTTTGDVLIHIINYSGQSGNGCLEPVLIHDAELILRECEGMTCKALVANQMLELKGDKGTNARHASLPPIGVFEVLWLSHGRAQSQMSDV